MLEWVLGHSPQGAASHSQTGETTEVGIDCGRDWSNDRRRNYTLIQFNLRERSVTDAPGDPHTSQRP